MKVFLDIYLALNFGDDLFLDIILKRYPNVTFITNYVGERYEKFFKNYSNVTKRNYTLIHKILRRLTIYNQLENYDEIAKECECVIFLGGSIFRDEPYHSSLYLERNKIVSTFLKYKKKVFVLGSNFGPVINKNFYKDYYNFFKKCTDVCFRDSYSKNLFEDLDNVRQAPDIVFNLDISSYKRIEEEKLIGYSIIDFKHKFGLEKYHRVYVEGITKNIKAMIKQGYNCEILSFCEIEGDLSVAYEIKNNLTEEEKKFFEIKSYDGNIDEIIKQIAKYKYFIASRFHANILGLLLGKKLCPVVYNQKILNLLNDLQYSGGIIKVENLSELSNIRILETSKEYQLDNKIIKESENHFSKLDKLLLGV